MTTPAYDCILMHMTTRAYDCILMIGYSCIRSTVHAYDYSCMHMIDYILMRIWLILLHMTTRAYDYILMHIMIDYTIYSCIMTTHGWLYLCMHIIWWAETAKIWIASHVTVQKCANGINCMRESWTYSKSSNICTMDLERECGDQLWTFLLHVVSWTVHVCVCVGGGEEVTTEAEENMHMCCTLTHNACAHHMHIALNIILPTQLPPIVHLSYCDTHDTIHS